MAPMRLARLAGFLYLVIIVCGISSELFIRSSLIVAGDANATAANILASRSLFRLGFVLDSIMLLADVAIAIVFYLIFRPVDQLISLTAAAFRLMQAAILGFNLLNYHGALLLLGGAGYAAHLAGPDLNALALYLLDLHGHGYDLGLIFFGVSNLALGYLVVRSGFVPGVFGYGLVAAAVVYLLGSYVRFVAPELLALVEPLYLVPLLAELGFCLWLLVKGVRVPDPNESSTRKMLP